MTIKSVKILGAPDIAVLETAPVIENALKEVLRATAAQVVEDGDFVSG
jgi:hypothetical protein